MDEETRNELKATHESVLPADETPCIWMLAGVLTCWLCDRDLACETCPLDAALRHTAEPRTGVVESGPRGLSSENDSSLPRRPGEETTQPVFSEPRLEDLLTEELPELAAEGLYARDHMWALRERDGLVRVGLDPFAARVVGRLRCVVLAPVGTRLHQGHPCAWLDLPGGTLTLSAPVSGQVLRCNEDLARRADLEIVDPFGDEWLLQLQPFRIRMESRALMRAPDFAAILQEDCAAWRRELQRALQTEVLSVGQTLADGGQRVRNLAELLGPRGVHRLASRFLRPAAANRIRERGR